MLCDALLVNALTGVRITLLGWGETYRGNFQKLRGARSHVGSLPPSDLVLFADAYDVLYSADAAAIAAKRTHSRIKKRGGNLTIVDSEEAWGDCRRDERGGWGGVDDHGEPIVATATVRVLTNHCRP